MENMKYWDCFRTPPAWAKKPIQAGRLKGKTDMSPQWRIQAMTETFGPCGIGWKYEIVNLWTDQGPEGVVFAHAHINLYIKDGDKWSEPIPGIGGNKLVEKETRGLYANDEGYKMSLTDALSVAMKAIGVGADIYSANMDGSKYQATKPPEPPFEEVFKNILGQNLTDFIIEKAEAAKISERAIKDSALKNPKLFRERYNTWMQEQAKESEAA